MNRAVSLLVAAALTVVMLVPSLPAQAQGDNCTTLEIDLKDTDLVQDENEQVADLLTKLVQQDCLHNELVLGTLCPLVQELTANIEDKSLTNALTIACQQSGE